MKSPFTVFALFLFLCSTVSGKLIPGSHPRFIENKGQVTDQTQRTRDDVKFYGRGKGLDFYLRQTGISYQLSRIEKSKHDRTGTGVDSGALSVYRVDISWLGCNINTEPGGKQVQPGYDNFYTPACPRGLIGVKSFSSVRYDKIYQGVDLHYYFKEGDLKYDFIVKPHASYGAIKMKVEGAERIELLADGSLLIKTPLGDIIEGKPKVLQRGREIPSQWQVEGEVISFKIGAYNTSEELIIDPATRIWGTLYGGEMNEGGDGCSADAAGNVFMAGFTNSFFNIATTGAHQQNFAGGVNHDAYLVKFNSAGVRQWATYYGEATNEIGYGCAVDGNGDVYLAGEGTVANSTLLATPGSHKPVSDGGDAFLAKFNTNGTRIWATYYGGTGGESGRAVAIDQNLNVFLAGHTAGSTTAIATSGAHQTITASPLWVDGYVVKFNSSGVRQWGTYYGGNAIDEVMDCATDPAGNVILTGITSSTNGIATSGAFQPNLPVQSTVGYVVKFNASGTRQWGTYYGQQVDIAYGCCTDALGSVYVAGNSGFSNTVMSSPGSHQSTWGGGSGDAFLVKFNASGVRQWATFYGGTAADGAKDCFTDAMLNVYLIGESVSTNVNVISTSGTHQVSHGGALDAYIAKFDLNGVRQWGSYYGDTGQDVFINGCITGAGDIFISAVSSSTSNVFTTGAHQTVVNGNVDALLVKFNECSSPPSPVPLSANPLIVCSGSAPVFTVANIGTISWYNSLTSTTPVGSGSVFSMSGLQPGTYSLFAQATNSCGTSAYGHYTITVVPQATITVQSGTVCPGGSFTIQPQGAFSYSVPGGGLVVTPLFTTVYTIFGHDQNGCPAQPGNVIVTTQTVPPISISGPTSSCQGSVMSFSTTGNFQNYSWTGGKSGTAASYTFPTPGIHSVSVSGTSANTCSNSAQKNILVYPLPTVKANTNGTVVCAGESRTLFANGAATYTWNSATPGATLLIQPLNNVTYTLVGADLNGCRDTTTISLVVNICTSSSLTDHQGSLRIFPNPTQGIVTIENLETPAEVTVFDVFGRLILSKMIGAGDNTVKLPDNAAGSYILKVSDGNKTEIRKIILISN